MTRKDYKDLKSAGFIKQRQENLFSLRLNVTGGALDSKRLRVIASAAEKYGAGRIHLTSRQGVEIPFVGLENAEKIGAYLAENGVLPGACGATPRGVTACQGLEVCPHARIETQGLAQAVVGRYAGRKLPHKFKIGVTGCQNDCLKVEANDLGIKGALRVAWNKEACSFCGTCAKNCRAGAIAVDEKSLNFNRRRCRDCGLCSDVCLNGAWKGEPAYTLYFGGTFGRRLASGRRFPHPLYKTSDVFTAIDAALDFFSKHGRAGERFLSALEREGRAAFEKAVRAALAKDEGARRPGSRV